MSYLHEEARAFAERMKILGFTVYMAKSGTHGFVTDDKEERVLSFEFNVNTCLSGCYGPPSQSSGTGWRMDTSPYELQTKEDVQRALYAHPPAWAGRGWKHFTTVKQHLGFYGASSGYAKYE